MHAVMLASRQASDTSNNGDHYYLVIESVHGEIIPALRYIANNMQALHCMAVRYRGVPLLLLIID